jgi:transposase InsO family protein
MNDRITEFVRSCPECQQNKASRHHPYGLLSPLELPYTPWQSIAMDFITDLPLSDGCDQLWIIIDQFTKMAHFLPLPKQGKTAGDLPIIFARKVWLHHRLPTDIISDRDSCFTSEVWKEFLRLSSIRPRISTAFHPQTDGQAERLNQTIEAYLRSIVNNDQNDWVSLLPMDEFAYNNSVTTATGLSPFDAKYGFHPTNTNPAAGNSFNPASRVYAH